ncbi:MAG: winged helix-turn-helix transcriptional regulator [Methanoregula sp.]|jgi:DNA-binding HxlR family transcriptional regulator
MAFPTGVTSRVLVTRLHELEETGYIRAVIIKEKPRVVEWDLTEKGRATIPILVSIIEFGIRWYAGDIFEDKKPRTLAEVYPRYQEISRDALRSPE